MKIIRNIGTPFRTRRPMLVEDAHGVHLEVQDVIGQEVELVEPLYRCK